MRAEKYGKKKYLSESILRNVRQTYKSRYGMMPFAGNYSKDPRFKRTEWLCRCGQEREEESHLLSGNCRVYGEIREKYGNLEDDDELVKFFNEVLAKRDKLEEEKKTSNS